MRLEELQEVYEETLAQLLENSGVKPSDEAARAIVVSTWFLVELTKRWAGQKRFGNKIPIEVAVEKADREVRRRLQELDARALEEATKFLDEMKEENERRRDDSDDPPSDDGPTDDRGDDSGRGPDGTVEPPSPGEGERVDPDSVQPGERVPRLLDEREGHGSLHGDDRADEGGLHGEQLQEAEGSVHDPEESPSDPEVKPEEGEVERKRKLFLQSEKLK